MSSLTSLVEQLNADRRQRRQLQSSITQQQSNYDHRSGGLFGHFHLPNLGGITALKQLASGITAIPELVSSFAPGGEKAMGPQLAAGLTKSVFDVASTVGKVAGIPGTNWSLGDKLVEPLGSKLVSEIGTATGNDFTGDAWKPEDIIEQSRREGPISALVNQVGTVAMVAAPIEGGLSGAAKATATAAGEAVAGSAEATALGARAAELAQKASTAGKFAHPYSFVAENVGDLARAARAASTPVEAAKTAIADGENAAAATAGATASERMQSALDAELTAARDPLAGAAERVGHQGIGIENGDLLNELSQANVGAQPTTRLYRRGPDGDWWSTNPSTHAVGDTIVEDRLQTIDVPDSELAQLESAPHGNATKDRPAGVQYNLGNRQDLIQGATERRPDLAEAATASRVAADETKNAAEAAAREGAQAARPSAEAARYAERINAPTPAWARRTVEFLPDTVNRVIGQLVKPMDFIALSNVRRDMERYVEVAQRASRSSEAVTQMRKGAEVIAERIPELADQDISRMIGEEVSSRLDGTDLVENAVIGGANPKVTEELRREARRGYDGIPDEVWAKMTPEDRTALNDALDQATAQMKVEAKKRFDTLLASRKGSKGLEQQVLGQSDMIPMTKGQLRKYRSVVQDKRRLRGKLKRALDDRAAREGELAKDEAVVQAARDEVVRLQEQVGIETRTAQNLHDGVARVLRTPEATQRFVGDTVESVATTGSSLSNPATGAATVIADDGRRVNIAQQFDVDLQQWNAEGPTLVERALTNPVRHDGEAYSTGVWTNDGNSLSVQTYVAADGTQRVRGDIAVTSLGGEKLRQHTASIIGEAFGQPEVYDAAGNAIEVSQSPAIQALSANYVNQALDPKSNLNRVGNELSDIAEKADNRLTPEDVDTGLRVQMMMDYSLSRSNPTHELGDFFARMKWKAGDMPTSDALFQLVLKMSTHDVVASALMMDYEKVRDAMAWYYDSHDFVENNYRFNPDGSVRMTTLLDGSQRPTAELFYDLLAVTSINASPTDNLGRALMGLGNLDEFMASRKNAAVEALDLLERLDKIPPDMKRVKDFGLPTEVVGGREGTKLSNKLVDFPEVRALTEHTQMYNSPRYKVMDVLSGRLKLDEVTGEQLGANAEWWGQQEKALDPNKVPYSDTADWLDNMNVQGPEADLFRERARLADEYAATELPPTNTKHTPILASEDESGLEPSSFGPSREVTPQQFEAMAQEGDDLLAHKAARASDTVDMLSDDFIRKMYAATREKWGGGTLDTHTGEWIPTGEGAPDRFAVTMRPTKGGKTAGVAAIQIPPDADYATFKAAWLDAHKKWGNRLRWEDAGFGVFHNAGAKGGAMIELDPVMVVNSTHDADVVGAASHANGGAFHFPTMDGYWIPHIKDAYKNGTTLEAAQKTVKGELDSMRKLPTIAAAQRNAEIEHYGQKMIAKLIAFRDNLARPAESLLVTQDSVMAKIHGYEGTMWGRNGEVSQHSKDIRDEAQALGERLGRQVMPHEIQALAWVWTKQEIYRQEVGRALAYHDFAMADLDTMERMFAQGQPIDARAFDPYGSWWDGDLAFSRKNRPVLDELAALKRWKQAGVDEWRGRWNEEAQAELDRLNAEAKALPKHETTTAPVSPLRPYEINVEDTDAARAAQVREIQQGANPDAADFNQRQVHKVYETDKYTEKEKAAREYQDVILPEIQAAVENGDFDTARTLVTRYLVSYQKDLATTLEGGHFGQTGERAAASARTYLDPRTGEVRENATRRGLRKLEGQPHEPSQLRIPPEGEQVATSGPELHSRFFDEVRGATLDSLDQTGRLQGRLMKNADLGTLVHETGHMLRRILPESDLRQLERLYPGILGTEAEGLPTWTMTFDLNGTPTTVSVAAKSSGEARLAGEQMVMTPMPGKPENVQPRLKTIAKTAEAPLGKQRRLAEERFVADLLNYIRSGDKRKPFAPFEKVAATLEAYHGTYLDSIYGRSMNNDVKTFWDNLFMPEIVRPDAIQDPISMQYAPPGGVNPKQFAWETPAEFTDRTRQYGEARGRAAELKSRRRYAEKQVRKAEAAHRRMAALLQNPTQLEREALRLQSSIRTRLEQLGEQLDNPATSRIAAEWQPMWEGFTNLRNMVDEFPEVADYLDEIPESFANMLDLAAEHGFEPTHLPDLTAEMAQQRLFGHLSLGKRGLDQMVESRSRNARTGALHRAGLADRSIDSLAAGLVDATHEMYTNELIQWVEDNYATPYKGGPYDATQWEPWDSQKQAILTGTTREGHQVAVGTTQLIPKHVARALDSMSNPYTHWTFHTLTRMTKPWRTLLLTLSPKWYVNNVFGNAILATAEGVRWSDYMKAFHKWRTGEQILDIPHAESILSQIEGGESTLFARQGGERLRAAGAQGGKTAQARAAVDIVRHRLVRLNESFDEITRAAVYEKTLRTTGSRELALTRAHKAVVDYGDLSPIERGLVRSVIPFYSWQKGVLKLLMHFPADHPLATGVLLQLGRLHEEMLQDRLHGPIPDAYLGYASINGKLANLRPLNPLMDATQLITPEGITGSMFPFVDVLLRDAYNSPELGTGRITMGPTGAPVEKVDYASALNQQLLAFPQVRTAQNLIGQPDIYGQQHGLAGALGTFLGAPRSVSDANAGKIAGRVQTSDLASRLSPYYSADWAERIAEGYIQDHPDATPEEIDAYVARIAQRRG